MLLEPGPLPLVDLERELPPRPTFEFEALTARMLEQLAGVDVRLAATLAIMAGDLAGSPTAGLDDPLARAAGEHASQVAGEAMALGAVASGAADLSDELEFVRGHFPPPGHIPPIPAVGEDLSNVFTGVDGALPPAPAPAPPAPGGGGDGGGDGGGAGGAPGTRELLDRYMDQNPSERPRIERFLADNRNPDGSSDWDRAPSALNLPGWAEFVARNS
jgi:hypothetical protein